MLLYILLFKVWIVCNFLLDNSVCIVNFIYRINESNFVV